jgi:hypothetical protein
MSIEQQLEQLRTENAELKAKQAARAVFKIRVSEKGAISIYGLGKWPLTLYQSQLVRVLDHEAELRAFMRDNAAKLTIKENQ